MRVESGYGEAVFESLQKEIPVLLFAFPIVRLDVPIVARAREPPGIIQADVIGWIIGEDRDSSYRVGAFREGEHYLGIRRVSAD